MPVEFVGSLRFCLTTRSSLCGCLFAKLGSVDESSFRSVQFPHPWKTVVWLFDR